MKRDITDTGTRWFTVYVPDADTGHSPSTSPSTSHESYFRVGGADVTTESGFLDSLKSFYKDALGEAAVAAAFGSTATDGIVQYTQGDLVQYIGGKADTRVLDDSYTVHVLNRRDEDAALTSTDSAQKTFRSYLRLGKPNKDLELALSAATPPALVLEMIKALPRPPADTPINLSHAVEQVLSGDQPTRALLADRAMHGDDAALDLLEAIRVSNDPRATVAYGGSDAHRWALASLNGIHAEAVKSQGQLARIGSNEARDRLATRARAGDSVVRKKLQELADSKDPADAYGGSGPWATGGGTPPKTWAKALLKEIGADADTRPRFSLGDGIAMFSDKSMTITTPDALKVTVGKDARTVLGSTYSETYDVSDEVLNQIRSGEISGVSQITDKRLVTASLTERSAIGSWRTTKFDLAKTLNVGVADNGSFQIGSALTYIAGLKLGNLLGASFDANTGLSAAAPTGSKVELVGTGMETAWPKGKVNYKENQSLKGRTVTLAVDPVAIFCGNTNMLLTKLIRGLMSTTNAALAAYTAAFAACSAVGDTDADGEAEVKAMLETAEAIYLAVLAINVVTTVAMGIASIVQIATELASKTKDAASPSQPTNITLNSAGIKLQCGTSYLEVNASGVSINGTQVAMASPTTSFVPQSTPSTVTPTQLLSVAQL